VNIKEGEVKTFIPYITGLIFSSVLVGQAEKENLKITHLAGDFYIFTTYRDFKGTAFPSNGLYLVTDNGVVMIGSPWDTTQFQSLLDSIRHKHDKHVVMCIATHSHEDRTGGLEYYNQKGIKTFTTKQTDLGYVKKGVRSGPNSWFSMTRLLQSGNTPSRLTTEARDIHRTTLSSGLKKIKYFMADV
jgi:hypothetical protein